MNITPTPYGLWLLLLALAAAQPARAQIIGDPETRDLFGNAVAAGDFDRDNYVDLAIGVPYEDLVSLGGSLSDAGAINVVYGAPGGLSDDDNQTWTQNSTGIGDTAEDGDLFGAALAVGDFDFDGYDDLAIGAPGEERGGLPDVGQVHVLYGSSAGLTATGSFYFPNLTLAHAGKRFGAALAAGDLNGDRRGDLAVGIPGQDLGAAAAAGAVAIYFGSDAGLVTAGYQAWHQNSAGITDQAEAGDNFGYALTAGDFDGDTRDDLAIGVPFEDRDGFADAGVTHVLYGASDGLSAADSQIWYQGIPGIEGSVETGDRFGFALASGDFNNDFPEDLAVGVPYEGVGSFSASGAVNVLYGSTGTGLSAPTSQIWYQGAVSGLLDTYEAGDRFGEALAAGDFDLDGYDDLAIGVPYEDVLYRGSTFADAGVVNVIYGTAGAGLSEGGDQLWSQASTGIPDAVENGDHFGAALAAGAFGTTNADALAVGVPYENVGATLDAGAASVIYGSSGTGLGASGAQFFYQGLAFRLLAPFASEEAAEGTALTAASGRSTETSAFALLSPAPNPFAGRSTLRFTLPEAAPVQLTVYDALGRAVGVLVDETREAGVHAVAFDAASLPAGVYVARMDAGGTVRTQRLTVLR